MKNIFQNRGPGFYLSLIAGAAALLGAVLYLILDGGDKTFTPVGFGLALAGAASTALVVFTRLKFAPFIPSALYAAAFGVVLRVAVPSLSDVWNKVNFIGGNAAMGMGFPGPSSCAPCPALPAEKRPLRSGKNQVKLLLSRRRGEGT